MAGIVRKAPKVPAWKKPLKNVKPKLPTSGHYGPSIYNPSGRNQAYSSPKPFGFPIPGGWVDPVTGGTGVPGNQPNWNTGAGVGAGARQADVGSGLINGDWEVQEAESNLAAMMGRKRGDFQGGLRQAFIDYGGADDTGKLGSLGKYLDAETIKKAVENKYSTVAQNKQTATRARDVNNAALAARGMLNSGATVKAQQDVSGQQEAANYQGLRGFLETGQAGLTELADLETQGAREIAMARFAAAQRAASQYPGAFGEEQYGYMGEAGANGTMFAPSGNYGPGGIAGMAGAGFNPNYKRPTMMTRKQFLQKKPQGRYQNYANAYRRQHPYGY